jgi:DNA-binding YbaB/EbfC family protein
MKGLTDLMGKAREMQARMQEMQEKLAMLEVEGMSGGGLVRCTLSGKGLMTALHIDGNLLTPTEGEVLEDLVIAAQNDAKGKLEARAAEEMRRLGAELGLPPGFNLPF